MHIHILGVAGTFMGGLAQLARQAGFTVTGSDKAIYPPMSTALEAAGIEVIQGYEAELLPAADLYVIGNAIARGNPMLEKILNARLPYVSGPQWLHDHILPSRTVLAVAGTHGKTTTTSMLTWILRHAGLKPGFLIGGVPSWSTSSAELGEPNAPFVIEADEYDTCFCDKRSKFVHYAPSTVILNNLEFDHADIFENLTQIETQFHHLVKIIPAQGMLVVNDRYESLKRVLARGCWTPNVAWFAHDQGWHVATCEDGPHVMEGSLDHGLLQLCMPGHYNEDNALAAMLAASSVGVSVQDSLKALAAFTGVKRRQDVVGEVNGITVMDDFAHHPTAIALTLQAVKARHGGRVFAIVEPRSNTMKLGTMKEALAPSLQAADKVFAFQGSSVSWSVEQALAPLGEKLTVSTDLEALIDAIVHQARPGDLCLVMSNGAFGGIHQKLLARLGS